MKARWAYFFVSFEEICKEDNRIETEKVILLCHSYTIENLLILVSMFPCCVLTSLYLG